MKKLTILFAFLGVLIVMSSCTATNKAVRDSRKDINGTWQLQKVEADGITGQFKADIFNEADFNCFIGSTWQFNNNNSLGSYTVMANAGNNCNSLQRKFRWSVTENMGLQNFQFKRLTDDLKEMEPDKGGFIFRILEVSPQNFKIKSDFTFEGKPSSFIYTFVKI